MDKDIKVSIHCLVFNHGKYLRKCLDAMLMQKTSFRYEILIHDDASSDDSASIIREYQAKYPDIVKPIIQTENQFSKGQPIFWKFQFPRIQGKYVAFCEGDDYWTDKMKLQKQFDIMEQNNGCYICTHFVQGVDGDGKKIKTTYPPNEITTGLYTQNDFIQLLKGYPFQTSSYFIRKDALSSAFKSDGVLQDFLVSFPVGDYAYLLLAANLGDLYYINESMSCYRHNVSGSWSSRTNANADKLYDYNKRFNDGLLLYKSFSDHKFDDFIDEKVESRNAYYNYEIDVLTKGKSVIFTKKHRKLFYSYSLKGKIAVIIECFFPHVYEYIRKRHNNE